MKIGVVTWFHYKNYGTVLQAYALQQFLKTKGYNCVLVNYIPVYNRNFLQKVKYGKFNRRIKNKIEAYRFKFSRKDIKEKLVDRNELFENFVNKNINLTPKIQSKNDLLKLNDIIDCFICGSDQIWNPENLNGVYFLNFVSKKRKKISYAPSFGVSHISASKKKIIQQWINGFDKLSVREEIGANILKSLTKKDVEVVVDPTLLLSREDWEQIIVNPDINEDYILCYFLGDRKEYWEVVQKLQRLTGYRVVIIPIRFNSYLQKYDIRISTGPEDFIGLIKNAELIITDSFHGTIFSLIFQKDFYVFKRFKDKAKDSQNSRIYNILKLVNLENRLIQKNFLIRSKNDIYIDNYECVNRLLNEKIESSISFLIKALNNFDEDLRQN